jgi:hypothetical protein
MFFSIDTCLLISYGSASTTTADFPLNSSFTGCLMSSPLSLLLLKMNRLLSILLVFAFTQGCANNLQAVQEFAKLSAESAEYTRLVEDYVDFPNRQKRYHPPGRHARLEEMARERATQQQALLLRQSLVEEYMQALARLASDEAVDTTEELNDLTTALQTQAGTDPQETEAFGRIAGIVTKAATNRWRQRQLNELIEHSNPPLQHILESLKHIVSEGFGGDLQTEEAAIRNYYSTLIMDSQDPAGKAALAEWQELRMDRVRNRAQAVHTYRALLEKIAEGHQELFDHRQNLDKQQVLHQVAETTKDLRALLETFKNL